MGYNGLFYHYVCSQTLICASSTARCTLGYALKECAEKDFMPCTGFNQKYYRFSRICDCGCECPALKSNVDKKEETMIKIKNKLKSFYHNTLHPICKNCGHPIYSKDDIWLHEIHPSRRKSMYDIEEDYVCECGCSNPKR